jgi:hypothetical protein
MVALLLSTFAAPTSAFHVEEPVKNGTRKQYETYQKQNLLPRLWQSQDAFREREGSQHLHEVQQ